jgi:outer membrane protein TolC
MLKPLATTLSLLLAATWAALAAPFPSGDAEAAPGATNSTAIPGNVPTVVIPASPGVEGPMALGDVLRSVTNQYPPLLAALIERDIANGRLRSAQGVFDFNVFAKAFGNPTGYYESRTLDAGFEQFLGAWGSSVFGGYRLTRGALPDYDKNRTQSDGEPRIGVRIPLLRDGSIDRRRAAVLQARLDRELADPFIQRQQLDFIRAAAFAYWQWLGAGQRLGIAEELLRVAIDRGQALTNQANAGLIRPIVLTDNQRLVVSRQIGVVQSRRRFEASAIALSLFHRDGLGNPMPPGRGRLPKAFPVVLAPDPARVEPDMVAARVQRPELRRLRLQRDRADIDRRLAKNNLLPNLDVGASVSQDFGAERYKDKSQLEVEAGIEFKLPLQRREAQGRLEAVEAQIERIGAEEAFARDRIAADIRDAFSAWEAAFEQARQTRLNVELALDLQEAEKTLFERGAADLLALQIREQATFEARVLEADALAEYFRARADYDTAIARPPQP